MLTSGISFVNFKKKNILTFKNLYLQADDVKQLVEDGYLNKRQISNLGDIPSESVAKSGKVTKFFYLIRWYDKTDGIFPKILQVFRLSCGQPAVNFPALTAKYLYETYTSHVDEPITIYDSSSGWGGRIIGAMSMRKKAHYVGTDPNPDTKGRYEAVANFYNNNCIDNFSENSKHMESLCIDFCKNEGIELIIKNIYLSQMTNIEENLRNKLRIPAINLNQQILVSEELEQTSRVMVKDEDVCLHCGLCAERCPTGAWDMQNFLYQEAKAYS